LGIETVRVEEAEEPEERGMLVRLSVAGGQELGGSNKS
jgi:hypothetical protein